ncbi:MAG: NAD(P)/FAD-dependent oxidoreductase [Candidatus Nanoarchaeia archaeon]
MEEYDYIIIGGGPGGYSSAIYAARYNLKTLVIAKERGGLITTTHLIENWPGVKSATGLELMDAVEAHVKHLNVPIVDGIVLSLEKDGDTFIVKTRDDKYKAKAILLATGTKHRHLTVPGAEEFNGRGISYCATCDGAFFKNKVVAVIGGSDTSAKEALVLSEIAAKTYIIYRREKIRAEPINYDRVMKKVEEGKIEIIYRTNITEVKGDKMVTGVTLDNEFNGSKELELQGVFGAIGLIPQTGLAKSIGVDLDERGEIKIDRDSKTNIPGVYAAGDCTDSGFKQAITAAAEGCTAANSAFQRIR